jgi:hypothetical protein
MKYRPLTWVASIVFDESPRRVHAAQRHLRLVVAERSRGPHLPLGELTHGFFEIPVAELRERERKRVVPRTTLCANRFGRRSASNVASAALERRSCANHARTSTSGSRLT